MKNYYSVQVGQHATRVRTGSREHKVYLRGALLGTLTEGRESAYFRSPRGHGRMYVSIEAFDKSLRQMDKVLRFTDTNVAAGNACE